MSLCAAAASVAAAFLYFGTLEVDSSVAAAIGGDLVLDEFVASCLAAGTGAQATGGRPWRRAAACSSCPSHLRFASTLPKRQDMDTDDLPHWYDVGCLW